ncbi:MAG: zinc-binding dehydrogenase [Thermoanaerobaculia bacterium]
MRAWMKANGRLELRDAPEPNARSNEWLVKVEAISLNRGEVRGAALAGDGTIPGWDVAGRIVDGPEAGRRVAAMVGSGAWAEYAAVPMTSAAFVPDEVASSIAATLPLAGLTVMRALAVGGAILGKRVLITGATGGVGSLAMQLAAIAGARVNGVSAVDASMTGDYDLILESAGGRSLERAIELVASGGVVVTIGNSSEEPASFNPRSLYRKGGASIYGLLVFEEVESRRVGARELAYLLELVRAGTLVPVVKVERSWRELDRTLDDLAQRRFRGKAVLKVD